jgi:DNA ligase (NAD+)
MDKTEEISLLAQELKKYREAYYNLDSIATDQEYDAKKSRLLELDPTHFEVTVVGAIPSKVSVWDKVRHEIPMGSLNKVNSIDEFKAWAMSINTQDFFITHKIDGSSMELIYKAGKLIRCTSRGDGIIGEDVTENIKQIPSIPKQLSDQIDVVIRGEVVMHKNIFQTLYSEIYANPRNTAAGKVRDKKNGGADCQNLEFIAYWIFGKDRPNTMSSIMDRLNSYRFNIPHYYDSGDIESICSSYNKIKLSRDDIPYEIDGMVISVNSINELEELGEHNMRPKGQIAWKFDPAMSETNIVDIKWTVGSSGRITPVAIVNPVNIGGVIVTNVSLHNLSLFRDLKLSKGNRVLISRRNDVIPYCERNLDLTEDT